MSKLYDLLNTMIIKLNASVKTMSQTLTDDQKSQARTNIGAASSDHTQDVEHGGTGVTSVTANSFLVGNGTAAMMEKTPAEVLALIGAASLADNLQNAEAFRNYMTSALVKQGPVAINEGGTNATTTSEAIENLGIYPVGAVYRSFDNTSPASLFGGTWTKLDDDRRQLAIYMVSTKGAKYLEVTRSDITSNPTAELFGAAYVRGSAGSYAYVSGLEYMAADRILIHFSETVPVGGEVAIYTMETPSDTLYVWKRIS